MTKERVQRRLAAILAVDIVGYSRLMEVDEEGTLDQLRRLRADYLHPKVAADGGRVVKTTGDGTLIEFPSAVDAVRHAIEVQREMASRNAGQSRDQIIEFRMGINLGDIVIEGDDIYGDGVNVAARLEGLAPPGGICISRGVRDQIANKIDVALEDMGPQHVKNISREVQVFRIHLNPDDAVPAGLPAVEPPDEPSVAVLPFTNMSGDPDQEYFSDGITEDIITDLSKVSGLFVIARNSSFTYKGKPVLVKEVGRELGVRYVLEGSVRKAGNRLRITGQLIDCATDRHLWAERFDRDLEDVFAVQEEVAREVVRALEVTLLPAEDKRLTRIPTANVEAYDEWLRGRLALHPPTKENIAEGRRRFKRVIELDPNFSGGYAGLANVQSLELFLLQQPRTEEALREVLDLANKAMAVSGEDGLGWAYSGLAWANAANGRHDEMMEAALKGAEIQPGDAETRAYLGLFLTFGGRPLEAIPHIEAAIRLSPRFFVPFLNFFGYANALAGNHDAAINAVTQNPPGSYSPVTFSFLITAYFEKGDVAKAKDTAQFALERYPNRETFNWVTFGLKRREDRERLTKALTESGIALDNPSAPPAGEDSH